MTVLFPLRESFESDSRLINDEETACSEAWVDLVDLTEEACPAGGGCTGWGTAASVGDVLSHGVAMVAVLERVRLAIGGSSCGPGCGGCDGPSARWARGCLVGER